MNQHPFTIVRGSKDKLNPAPKKYATFNNKRALMERIIARHIADRNKIILKLRAQGKL